MVISKKEILNSLLKIISIILIFILSLILKNIFHEEKVVVSNKQRYINLSELKPDENSSVYIISFRNQTDYFNYQQQILYTWGEQTKPYVLQDVSNLYKDNDYSSSKIMAIKVEGTIHGVLIASGENGNPKWPSSGGKQTPDYTDLNNLDKNKIHYFILNNNNTLETTSSIKPISNAGEVIYFRNMDPNTFNKQPVITFTSTQNDKTKEVVTPQKVQGTTNLYKITIPSSNTAFILDKLSIKIDDDEIIKDKALDSNKTNNTFYYDLTQLSDGTKLSKWDKYPTDLETTSIASTPLFINARGTINDKVLTKTKVNQTFKYTPGIDETKQTILEYISTTGIKYHFMYNNDFISSGTNMIELGPSNYISINQTFYENGINLYFDATMSLLKYSDSSTTNQTMPLDISSDKIYVRAYNDSNLIGTYEMKKQNAYVTDTNTWKNVFNVYLPEHVNKVEFFGYNPATNVDYKAAKTSILNIPDLENPCFYADTGDTTSYDNVNRGGYWDEVYMIRDPEKIKQTQVTTIEKDTSGESVENTENTIYLNTTFYDYFTDYELNGNNRSTYPTTGGIFSSHRNWVPFREFNQALSDYYKQNNVKTPIYAGHFQPNVSDWGITFSEIAPSLNLYGYNTNETTNYNFFAVNNSTEDSSGAYPFYSSSVMGLASKELSNGLLQTDTTTSQNVSSPYFDKQFLNGENSKNSKLANIIESAAFPFTKSTDNGVDYWEFDSDKSTLQIFERTTDNEKYKYVLKNVGKKDWSINLNSASQSTNSHGFFPFNSSSINNRANTYNYGFGTKFEFNMKLDNDGYFIKEDGTKTPITFEFTGDDDLWIYIDGKLVSDLGGDHSLTQGKLNLAKDVQLSTMKSVKKTDNNQVISGRSQTIDLKELFPNDELYTGFHKVEIFYMERGMWESNLKLRFNLPNLIPSENLIIRKIDRENPNKLLQGATYELLNQNNEVIQTETTKENGELTFSEITPNSKYYIREKIAPKGYEISDDVIEINVSENGDITTSSGNVTKENEEYILILKNQLKEDIPKTGGSGPIIYSLLGLFLVIGSIILLKINEIKEKKKNKKSVVEELEVIAVLLVSSLFISLDVNAKDLQNPKTISGNYKYDTINISETDIGIYEIATYKNNKFIFNSDYKSFDKNLDNYSSSEIKTYTEMIYEYIKNNNLKYDRRVKTSSDGSYKFDNLLNGIYLIVGDEYVKDNYKYISMPSLVIIRTNNNVNFNESNIKVNLKTEKKELKKSNNTLFEVPNTYDDIIKYVVIFIMSLLSILYVKKILLKDFEKG